MFITTSSEFQRNGHTDFLRLSHFLSKTVCFHYHLTFSFIEVTLCMWAAGSLRRWTGDVGAGRARPGAAVASSRLTGPGIISRWPFPELRNGPRSPAEVLRTGEPRAVSRSTACPPGADPGLPSPRKRSSKTSGPLKRDGNRISTLSSLAHVRHTSSLCFLHNLCFQTLRRNKAVPRQRVLLSWSGVRWQQVLFPSTTKGLRFSGKTEDDGSVTSDT